jgi:hypothetical protein
MRALPMTTREQSLDVRRVVGCLNSRYAVMNIYRLDQLSGNISSLGPDEASAIRDPVNGAINDSGKIIRRPQQHREDRGGGGADRYTRGRCEHSSVCGARFRRRADCASSAAASGSTHHCARAAPAPATTGGHPAGRLVGLQPRLLGLRPRRIWLRSGSRTTGRWPRGRPIRAYPERTKAAIWVGWMGATPVGRSGLFCLVSRDGPAKPNSQELLTLTRSKFLEIGHGRGTGTLIGTRKHTLTCINTCAPGRIRTCDTGFRRACKPSRWWYRKVF